MSTDLYKNKEWLEQKYIDERLTQTEIASLCGVNPCTIRVWMKRFGIEGRSPKDSCTTRIDTIDKDTLEEMYLIKKMSQEKIAHVFNVAVITISKKMRNYGIPARTKTEQWTQQKRIEQSKITSKAWLRGDHEGYGDKIKLAWERGAFDDMVEKMPEVTKRKWEEGVFDNRVYSDEHRKNTSIGLQKHHADHPETGRKISERAKENYDNNPERRRDASKRMFLLWQDSGFRERMCAARSEEFCENWGINDNTNPYPYVFNERFRKEIRERDNCKCAICRLEAKSVHHIDYNKKNTTQNNCIVLCRSCHGKTNRNRVYWHEQLSNIMVARGCA